MKKILYFSQFTSEISNTLLIFILSILIYDMTGAVKPISILWTLYICASIFSHLLMGGLVDRINRKVIMMLSEFGRGVVFLLLYVFVFNDNLNVHIIYLSVVFIGMLEPLFHPACMSYVVDLFDESEIQKANANLEIIAQSATIAGPGIGGFLLTLLDKDIVIALITINLFVSGVLVSRLKNNYPLNSSDKNVFREISEGFIFFKSKKIFIYIGILIFLFNMSFGMIQPLLLPYIDYKFKLGEFEYGVINTTIAIGMILGAYIIKKDLLGRVSLVNMMIISLILSGLCILFMGINGYFIVFVILFMLYGIFISIFNINNTYLYQTNIDEKILGRVFAIRGLIAIIGLPIGYIMNTLLINHMAMEKVFMIAGVIIFFSGVIIFNKIKNINQEEV